jgi:hypothetical protein
LERLVQETVEALSRINNLRTNRIDWTSTNLGASLRNGIPSFRIPAIVRSTNPDITVTISAEGQTVPTEFSLLQQQEEDEGWSGSMPDGMNVVVNREIAPVRLTFSKDIYAFSAYIQVSEL